MGEAPGAGAGGAWVQMILPICCERSIVRRITQKLYRSSSPLGVTAGDHHAKLLCTECRLIKEPGSAEPLARQMETNGGEFSRRMWKLLDRPTRTPLILNFCKAVFGLLEMMSANLNC